MGILMLDTRFPRFLGDIGNPDTFGFHTRQEVIPHAVPSAVVRNNSDTLLPHFIAAAKRMEEQGAKLITTSCGFLTPFQHELEKAVDVPVLTSSLFMFNRLQADLPHGKRLAILTIAASSLSNHHLEAAAIPANVLVASPEYGSEFTEAILENHETLDFDMALRDNVTAARNLVTAHENVGGILLECTNMPPYRAAIMEATGLPVYSIIDGLNAMWREADV